MCLPGIRIVSSLESAEVPSVRTRGIHFKTVARDAFRSLSGCMKGNRSVKKNMGIPNTAHDLTIIKLNGDPIEGAFNSSMTWPDIRRQISKKEGIPHEAIGLVFTNSGRLIEDTDKIETPD